jgi:hypothetical protein
MKKLFKIAWMVEAVRPGKLICPQLSQPTDAVLWLDDDG